MKIFPVIITALILSLQSLEAIARQKYIDNKNICEKERGVWREFGNSCGNYCADQTPVLDLCSSNIIFACDCGAFNCWDEIEGTCRNIKEYKDQIQKEADEKLAAEKKAEEEKIAAEKKAAEDKIIADQKKIDEQNKKLITIKPTNSQNNNSQNNQQNQPSADNKNNPVKVITNDLLPVPAAPPSENSNPPQTPTPTNQNPPDVNNNNKNDDKIKSDNKIPDQQPNINK